MNQSQQLNIENRFRVELSESVGNRPYRMWFENTQLCCTKDSIEIIAANHLAATWIRDRFSSAIEKAMNKVYEQPVSINVAIQSESKPEQKINCLPKAKKELIRKLPTKKMLGFDDFVTGSCNQLACAAAKQIASPNGLSVSPLFIYGACGVGKTHLLQAICKHAKRTSPANARYITAEQFTNEFIASSRIGDFARFRNRYRTLDLLAIDDIHFVASKTKTQEELLHTLDAAGLRGARLVLASDEDPRQIHKLNRALANRFVAGMIAEITRPDRETRKNIIKRLTESRNIALTPGAINHLASYAVGSIREIEGTITRLKAATSLLMEEKDTFGIDAVELILRATPQVTMQISMSHVIDTVCKRAGISAIDLKGKSRTSTIVFWRSVASYLGRRLTSLSYPELAVTLGRKNHSTVHAAVKRISAELENSKDELKIGSDYFELREVIDQLTWAIRSNANRLASQPRIRKEPTA